MRTSCWVIVLPPAEIRPRRPVQRRRTIAPAMPIGSTPGMVVVAAILDRQHRLRPRAAGIADSATGRRFSRSPLMSEVSSGASSVTVRSACVAELEALDAVGGARRRPARPLRSARGGAGC